MHDLRHRRLQFGLRCQQRLQRDRRRQHSMVYWHIANALHDQVSRARGVRCARPG